MKFYGHANLQQNQLQNATLETLTAFPPLPGVGQIAFMNSIVYICVAAGALPVWVPLTNEITAYTHPQVTAATTWYVVHGLNTSSVNFQVFDNSNRVVIPDQIETTSANTATITFAGAMAGRAVCISGMFDGNVKPTYAFTFQQGAADSAWTIVHNLGYYPIVRVFIGSQEVQPLTIIHDSLNQITVTFSTPQVGYARLI
jgi:hypothetical protein